MRTIVNLAISACLFSLIAINISSNPFLSVAHAQAEEGCLGDPPIGQNCGCCEEDHVWVCE